MPFDPSSAQLMNAPQSPTQGGGGFDPSTAQLMSSAQSSDAQTGGDTLDKFNATMGGVAKGLANIPQAIGDTPTFIMQHLHLISPDTANKLYQANKENSDLLRPSSDSVPGQAISQHPNYAAAGEQGTNLASMAGGMGLTGMAGEGASALVQGAPRVAGVLGRAAGMGLLNASMADPADKGQAALVGAASSPAMDAAGSVLAGMGSKSKALSDLSNTLSSTSKSEVGKAYDVVKAIPFSGEDKTAVDGLVNQVQQLGTDPNLSKVQQRLLGNLSDQLGRANSHGDILKISQNMQAAFKDFKGLKATDAVFAGFKDIKANLVSTINQAATREGVDGALTNASQMASQAKITDKVFGKMGTDAFNFTTANKDLQLAISKYEDIPSMSKTVDNLKGLQKVTAQISNRFVIKSIGAGAVGSIAGFEVASGGNPANYKAGAIGGAVGGIGGALIAHVLGQFAMSPEGSKVLQSLAKPGVRLQMVGDVAKAVVAGILHQSTGKANQAYGNYGGQQ